MLYVFACFSVTTQKGWRRTREAQSPFVSRETSKNVMFKIEISIDFLKNACYTFNRNKHLQTFYKCLEVYQALHSYLFSRSAKEKGEGLKSW